MSQARLLLLLLASAHIAAALADATHRNVPAAGTFPAVASAGDVIERRAGAGTTLARRLEIATGGVAAPQSRMSHSGNSIAEILDLPDEVYWDGFELCGNGIIDGVEQCDRTDLGGATCGSLGYPGGSLTCTRQCQFDTSQCVASCSLACNTDADCGGPACGPCFENICLGGLGAAPASGQ